MTGIRRNPFARQELSRETVPNKDQSHDCDWCGNKPERLHKYTVESDGGSSNPIPGEFCNLDCLDSYTT